MGTVGCSCSTTPHPSHHHHHLLLVIGFFLTLLLQTVEVEPSALNCTRYRKVSSLRLQRIQRHLDNINKPPVLTIEVINMLNMCMYQWLKMLMSIDYIYIQKMSFFFLFLYTNNHHQNIFIDKYLTMLNLIISFRVQMVISQIVSIKENNQLQITPF